MSMAGRKRKHGSVTVSDLLPFLADYLLLRLLLLIAIVPSPRRCSVDAFVTSSPRTRTSANRGGAATRPPFCVIPPDRTVALPDDFHVKVATRHPRLAQDLARPGAFVRPAEEWFRRYLDLSDADAARLTGRLPRGGATLRRLGRPRLHAWLAFLLSDAAGLDRETLRRVLVARPQLLAYRLANVRATTAYFREELGLARGDFAAVVRANPSALMHSVDGRLRPAVAFLQDEVGGGADNWVGWRKVIRSYPRVFSYSVERTLVPKLRFLCRDEGGLGLSRGELTQVVGTFPPTLWLSTDNLQSKLDFLTDSLGLDRPELLAIVVSYPQILGLSLQHNLRLKMEFFLVPEEVWRPADPASLPPPGAGPREDASAAINCGLSKRQLKEFVLYQPALLAYSLENRLKPRIACMQENNISFYYCPKNIMSYTNVKFDSWMSTQVDTWSVSE